ncbi:Endonuclease/exonuclease/phosphatase [Pseudopedobacter saltans DSM 12145]|uniref:Endonuclease/exonuclease/phosphatase n=1 Tax=Pseudopedobacter saltans (strain ATCC 51119 / DSM 12145 / JCM 21818 / CCUG 39354 / LMG 10337 / NBRC 100064 / NCIMB 13643) TaxID=762903 RepID=F0SE08_PSESL|nr:endonuclease/exonuclease/phosphatase family protein [Pseudopedobacter saltans]ADY52934.1 Endonuclease/exonuclease/phosphatase [Pseudopedobacter saltans DSM 12145]
MKNLKILIFVLLVSMSSISCGKSAAEPEKDNKPPVEEKSGPTFKVMSYNIHIGNPPSKDASYRDLEAIAQVINIQKPDLVALSEVDNKTKRSGTTVDQAKELGRLTGMYYYFTKAMDYQGGEYGDAVLSKFPIAESKRYELPVTGTGFEPRSLALILVEKEGHKFYFGSTHLDHTSAEDNRVLQANTLVDIIKSLNYPLVLAGDWNALPTSQTINILKKALNPTCTDCPYTFPMNKPDRTIDYIMYKPAEKFKVKSLKVVNETYASDHLPLVVDLEIK